MIAALWFASVLLAAGVAIAIEEPRVREWRTAFFQVRAQLAEDEARLDQLLGPRRSPDIDDPGRAGR